MTQFLIKSSQRDLILFYLMKKNIKIASLRKSRREWQEELDPLLRQACFTRDQGKCVRCGRPPLAPHHLYRKGRYTRLRYDLDNVLSLCFYHHQEAHLNGLEFANWFNEKYPARAKYLRLRSQVNDKSKPDWNAIKLYLVSFI